MLLLFGFNGALIRALQGDFLAIIFQRENFMLIDGTRWSHIHGRGQSARTIMAISAAIVITCPTHKCRLSDLVIGWRKLGTTRARMKPLVVNWIYLHS